MRELDALNRAVAEVAPRRYADAAEFLKECYENESLPLPERMIAARAVISFQRPSLSAQHVVTSTQRSLEDLLLEKARIAHERGVSLNVKPAIEGEIVDHDVGNIVGTLAE